MRYGTIGTVAAIVTAFLLGACSPAGQAFNPQAKSAGITDVSIEFTDEGKIKSARIRDGKEKDSVAWDVDLTKMTLKYAASSVKAFEGQGFRAEVEKIVSNNLSDTVKTTLGEGGIATIVNTVVDAFKTSAAQ